MKPKSPCYNCTERILGCHSECDLYLTFRRALDDYNRLVKDVADAEARIAGYEIERNRKKRTS